VAEGLKRSFVTLEQITNIATIVACLAVCFAIARQTIWPARTNATSPTTASPPYAAGERLNEIPTVNFEAAPRTLVLFVRSTCHFCDLSMPFYRALSSSPLRKRGLFQLVAASIESPAATREYLEKNQISVDQVVAVAVGNTKVRGTPTLLLVDRRASVVQAWVGLLPKAQEQEVWTDLFRQSALRLNW
jgi:hypothetical protein